MTISDFEEAEYLICAFFAVKKAFQTVKETDWVAEIRSSVPALANMSMTEFFYNYSAATVVEIDFAPSRKLSEAEWSEFAKSVLQCFESFGAEASWISDALAQPLPPSSPDFDDKIPNAAMWTAARRQAWIADKNCLQLYRDWHWYLAQK